MEKILIISYIAISIIGVLLHFTHQIFKKGAFLHYISAINESTWEHTKLAFYPVLMALLIHSYIPVLQHQYFWSMSAIVLIFSIILIPALYIPIRKILKKEITFVSISLYFITILICMIIEYYLIKFGWPKINNIWGLIGIFIMLLLYLIFTFKTPRRNLFLDPIHKKYGEFEQKFDKKN